jgi:formamidopyrimidine-DNA glycosylase
VPELPEVQALADDLTVRLDGRAVARVDVVAFSALKTFDPPTSALQGLFLGQVGRHGKFLDFAVDDLHLVVHLARAGWIRWRDSVPQLPPRPGKGPLAARLVLDDDSGLDFTEMGTQKRLAM